MGTTGNVSKFSVILGMSLIQLEDSAQFIPITTFDICLIDQRTKKEITEIFPSRKDGAYYLDKFDNYLKKFHNKTIKEYCIQNLKIEWPICPIAKEQVGFKLNGKGLIFSKFKVGKINKKFCPKFAQACEKFSEERKGKNNPMYGKKPWNKDLPEDHEYRQFISRIKTGIKATEETKQKQREARAKSPLKARHITPHSPESIEKMRIETAKRWASGAFNKVTSIHLKMRDFLESLGLKFVEEYQVKYFSLDFAFPESKIGIECQGTYFHIDPRIYPNGPINAIQRRNFGRDNAKRKIVCDQEGWTIIEVWETEINDGSFKEFLKCKLLELNLLNK